jgi:nucleotide-binding universal stress UspA family protein
MTFNPNPDISSAIHDFHQARNKAMLKEIIAHLTGEPTHLLSYDEVRRKMKVQGLAERGLKEIPVNAIIGSLGRYNDFTRDFLPRKDSVKDRWARVKAATSGLVGLPPIQVYQIGEIYFVIDGNHRVSVARHLGATYIQAYVIEVRTRVPLTPKDHSDDFILKSEYADFLDKTHLDELRPGSDLQVSLPGQYPILEEHISVHRYFMGIDQRREVSYEDGVLHWYDTIYLPVVKIIQELGILRFFPGRTETDLYLWIAEHRSTLEKELGWELKTETAIQALANKFDRRLQTLVSRAREHMIEILTAGKLLPGPPPGQWRKEMQLTHMNECLFREILVPISANEQSWYSLDQAIIVASKEASVLYGLHVIPEEAREEKEKFESLQEEFNRRCKEAGVKGSLAIGRGEIAHVICDRARFTDLVITNLVYPPGSQPIDRLESGFHDMVQKCPRPIIATPQNVSNLSRGLLSYDGSPKAEEALFIAAYLSGQWKISLVVISVNENNQLAINSLTRADKYLRAHRITATLVRKSEPVAEAILQTSEEHKCDFIIMGGYGYSPLLEVILGSTVNQVLQESHIPMLICR